MDEWADCTPEQAYTTLSKPDVVVTNKKDKITQLGKLQRFNDEVKKLVLSGGAAGAGRASSGHE